MFDPSRKTQINWNQISWRWASLASLILLGCDSITVVNNAMSARNLILGSTSSTVGPIVPSPTPNPVHETPRPSPSPSPSPSPLTGGVVFSPYSQLDSSTVGTIPSRQKVMTWAFATGECGNEVWEAGTSPASGSNQAMVNSGRQYIISTGGAGSVFTCSSDAGFSKFIDTYYTAGLIGIDFDIETDDSVSFPTSVINDLVQRVKVAQANPKYSKLRFSFTLQAGTSGIGSGSNGANVINALKKAGVTKYYINLMAFDFFQGQQMDMAQSAISAAQGVSSGFNIPLSQIEICMMVGPDDAGANETLTLANAATVARFALQSGLAGLHFWDYETDRNTYQYGYEYQILNVLGRP